MRIIVTGGLGFIGSAVVRMLIDDGEHEVLNLDKMTYAASPESVASVSNSPRYRFVRADIADGPAMQRVFAEYLPDAVIHLAAESHVDRSIDGPGAFIVTNVVGTYELLEAARHYWLLTGCRKGPALSLLARLDGRSIRISRAGRFAIQRVDALFPALALLCQQGRFGPSGAGMARNLRTAGRHHQLLEQLRPLSFSREADSLDDRQGIVG